MIKHKIDLVKGKAIYYKYKGDTFGISKDLGDEYKKCYIPQEIEEKWTADIIRELNNDIKNKTGNLRMEAILAYVQIVGTDEAISFLIRILDSNCLDTFSSILICEELKRFLDKSRNFLITDKQTEQIKRIIERKKNDMLLSKIIIDGSFKLLPHMKSYDFSERNIIKRISDL